MCGIAGIIDLQSSRDIDRNALRRMTDALTHRGPDGEGYFFAPGVGFGHRRLAIIDFDGGAQPFTSADANGVLTFNGEVYNFRDVSSTLAENGVAARTRSDTEALAEALNLWGAGALSRVSGMFAFGFWNAREKTLLLARDRLGEKPLYYARTEDGFLLFASEIGALAASGMVASAHSPEAVRDYFLFGYVPDPKSIFKAAHKLPPGSFLTAGAGRGIKIERYWRPDFSAGAGADYDASSDELLAHLDRSVGAQLVSDAPLGAFLSGGIDSSAIIASMAQAGADATACTIGFDDHRFDERPYARRTARRYGVRHIEEMATLNADGMIDDIAGIFGEPFADPSALPTLCVARAARKHVKVALSGDGADEIFLGYRRYPFFAAEENVRALAPTFLRQPLFGALGALYPKLDWAPQKLRLKTTLQALGEDRAHAYARSVAASLPDRTACMLSGDFLNELGEYDPAMTIAAAADAASGAAADPLSFAQAADLAGWLPGRMLTKIDRTSMAAGLEVRTPFLDHEFASWALHLPKRFLLEGGKGKRLLKSALADRIDADILQRKKQGFSIPLADWLRSATGPMSRLEDSSLWRQSGYFSPRAVDRMIANHRKASHDYSQELWTLIMFDAFLRHWRDGA